MYCKLTNMSQSTCMQGLYSSYRDVELSCDCPGHVTRWVMNKEYLASLGPPIIIPPTLLTSWPNSYQSLWDHTSQLCWTKRLLIQTKWLQNWEEISHVSKYTTRFSTSRNCLNRQLVASLSDFGGNVRLWLAGLECVGDIWSRWILHWVSWNGNQAENSDWLRYERSNGKDTLLVELEPPNSNQQHCTKFQVEVIFLKLSQPWFSGSHPGEPQFCSNPTQQLSVIAIGIDDWFSVEKKCFSALMHLKRNIKTALKVW